MRYVRLSIVVWLSEGNAEGTVPYLCRQYSADHHIQRQYCFYVFGLRRGIQLFALEVKLLITHST